MGAEIALKTLWTVLSHPLAMHQPEFNSSWWSLGFPDELNRAVSVGIILWARQGQKLDERHRGSKWQPPANTWAVGWLPLKLDVTFIKFCGRYHQYDWALSWNWNTNASWECKALPGRAGGNTAFFCRKITQNGGWRKKIRKNVLLNWLSVLKSPIVSFVETVSFLFVYPPLSYLKWAQISTWWFT